MYIHIYIYICPRCGVGSGGVDSVLGSLSGVESVVLPEWGLLVVAKLL